MSSLTDLIGRGNLDIRSVLAPVLTAPTIDVESSAIDTALYQAYAFIFDVGVSLDTLSGSLYHTLKVMECATSGGSYTAVADADIIGIYGVDSSGNFEKLSSGTNAYVIDAAAEDPATVVFVFRPTLRYVKAKDDVTGTHTNGTPLSFNFIGVSHGSPLNA